MPTYPREVVANILFNYRRCKPKIAAKHIIKHFVGQASNLAYTTKVAVLIQHTRDLNMSFEFAGKYIYTLIRKDLDL